jgi:hypothetical protein
MQPDDCLRECDAVYVFTGPQMYRPCASPWPYLVELLGQPHNALVEVSVDVDPQVVDRLANANAVHLIPPPGQ